MDAKETVLALFAAYRSGDPERIAAMLHPQVLWIAPAGNATQVALGLGSADDAGAPRGLNDLDHALIVDFMAHNYARFFCNVSIEVRLMLAQGDTVVVEHRMTAVLPNGRDYVNDYCFIYEVREGQVWRIREYMDTRGGWAQVFGDAPGQSLMAFATAPQ
ncbi:nuclear transport factor 2 family protein [Ramlibacter sp.]|uniref:nuclear transport factor 2 family protein n=1 Tax=Ramlibacter sp. TaxID=1917967 RepID=UPI00183897DD|nr:nuclear transport factor 2 family protein [Ramlibacter sp.]MBA2675257.1 nuclear transport factor 2 family protein [Ramlibacter sp.]